MKKKFLKDDVSFLLPTFNEEEHIYTLIQNLKKVNDNIFVLDSFSSDKTLLFCKKLNVRIYKKKWKSFSDKLNWGIRNNPFETKWIMRIDADELLDKDFISYFNNTLLSDIEKYDLISCRKKFYFMGKKIIFGGFQSLKQDRLFKSNCVMYEDRRLDEHLINVKKYKFVNNFIIENSKKDFKHWIEKHILYAKAEANMVLNNQISGDIVNVNFKNKIKRNLKFVYYKAPLFIRPFLFWIYRYIFLFGFLSGRVGFIYHILHSFIYRFLVDIFIFESKTKHKK